MLLHATSDALPFRRQRVAMPYAAPTGPGDGDPPPIGDPGDDDFDDGGDDDVDEDEEDEEPLQVHDGHLCALQHKGGKTAIINSLQRVLQVV